MKSRPVHYIMWRCHIGGAELMVNHYINAFGKSRPLHAYCLWAEGNEIYDESKIKVHQGGMGKFDLYLKYFQYCSRNKKDIFHLMHVGPLIFLLTLFAGVKNPVYHIHGTAPPNSFGKKYLFRAFWKLSSFYKNIIVATSRHSARIFNRDMLSKELKVVYNGTNTAPFLKKRVKRTELRRIAYIGRMFPGKNVDLVIRLFEEIAGDFPELELHLAGDGPLRPALEVQASKSIYAGRIKFFGFIKDIASFYQSVDLFLFLSAHESFGNVLVEALLTGLPILTSDIPVFREIYGEEDTFLLGDPSNYPELKDNFIKAIKHFPLLAEKAFSASDYIKAAFNIEKHVAEIERIYENN